MGASRGSDGSEDVVIVRNVCHGMVVRGQLWEVGDVWSSGGGGGEATMRT